jgi:hypothetical protein
MASLVNTVVLPDPGSANPRDLTLTVSAGTNRVITAWTAQESTSFTVTGVTFDPTGENVALGNRVDRERAGANGLIVTGWSAAIADGVAAGNYTVRFAQSASGAATYRASQLEDCASGVPEASDAADTSTPTSMTVNLTVTDGAYVEAVAQNASATQTWTWSGGTVTERDEQNEAAWTSTSADGNASGTSVAVTSTSSAGSTNKVLAAMAFAPFVATGPTITVQPIARTVQQGTLTTFSVTATGTAPVTYQWQLNDGSGWTNLTNGGHFSGALTPLLTIWPPRVFNGYQVRCRVTDLNGTTDSTAVTLTVTAAPRVNLAFGGEAPALSVQNSEITTSAYSRTVAQTAEQTFTGRGPSNSLRPGARFTARSLRASVDANASQVSTNSTTVPSDGSTSVTVYITALSNLTDANFERIPLAGIPADRIVVTVTGGTGNTVIQPLSATNANGSTTASFVTTSGGEKVVSATIEGVAVISSAVVLADGDPPVEVPSGDPFYTSGTTEATVRENNNGFTWGSGGSRVSVQEVPAGRTGWGLRFRYGADADGSDSSAEQRFNLGRNCAAVWIEYSLYIPANFAHRTQTTGATNNKFLMIWNTTYGSGSGTWQAGYEYLRAGDTSSNLRPMSSKEFGTNALYVTSGALDHPDNNKPFIGSSNPLTPGNWHTIRLQFQRSSAGGASDGVMKMWIDGTLFASMTNGPFRNFDNIGDTVLRNGYFMGWSNSGFTEVTDFFIHQPTFYDSDPGWT